jgi:hypothetical protein
MQVKWDEGWDEKIQCLGYGPYGPESALDVLLGLRNEHFFHDRVSLTGLICTLRIMFMNIVTRNECLKYL